MNPMVDSQLHQVHGQQERGEVVDVLAPSQDTVPTRREIMYAQHFVTKVSEAGAPAGFFQQVDGFGARVFAQMSSFGTR